MSSPTDQSTQNDAAELCPMGVRSPRHPCSAGDDTRVDQSTLRVAANYASPLKLRHMAQGMARPTSRHINCTRIPRKHSKGYGVQLTKAGSRLVKKSSGVSIKKSLLCVAAIAGLAAVAVQAVQADRVTPLRESRSWQSQAARLCALGTYAHNELTAAMARYGAEATEWPLRDGVAEALHCVRCERNPNTGLCGGHPSQDAPVDPAVVAALVATVNAEPDRKRKQARLAQVTRPIDFRFDFSVYSELLLTAQDDVEYPAPPIPTNYSKRGRVQPEVRDAWCTKIGPAVAVFARHSDAPWLSDALALSRSCDGEPSARGLASR